MKQILCLSFFFFELVKQKIDHNLEADVFSDYAPEFYNDWLQVMQSPKHHLLCIRHVDRNKLFRKIQEDQELKVSIYK